jgi:hypothetical protein
MTTSPTYQASGDQPEPDQHDLVPEEILTDPATNLAEPDAGQAGNENPARDPSLAPVTFIAPASMTDSRAASSGASPDRRWSDILAMFVDDPRASTERAAGLVDDRVEELIQAFRERLQSLQSAWQANHAGTEELRVAIRHYRAFWNSLEDLPPQT